MKTAVIGVGHLGKLHSKMYARLPESDFAGVYDVNQDAARQVAADFNIRAFTSLDEAIASADAFSVVTSTPYHFAVARQIISAGKPVFIEKPITTTPDEARQLIALAREKKVALQVGHIERFNPAILSVEKYDLRPMFIESHRLAQFKLRGADVAVVLDLMIHDIDIILHLVGSPVKRVDANGVGIVSGTIDIANARLQFENGCVANVTASRISQHPMRKMRIFQKNAYLAVDFSAGSCDVFRIADPDEPETTPALMLGQIDVGPVSRNIVYEQPEVKEVNALEYELSLFLNSILTGSEPPVTGEDGLRALEIAQEIISQIENNLKSLTD